MTPKDTAAKQADYAYIWQYFVRPERCAEFETHYGPEGSWVKLFRQHGGYIRTELHRDMVEANRYLTIDYWQSKEAFADFRKEFASQFEELDRKCELLTAKETCIGEFKPVR